MNEEKVINMLLDHEERLKRIEENMVTKKDMSKVYDTLDEVLKIVKKTDQEIAMLTYGQRKLAAKSEEHDLLLNKIKPLVGLS